MQLSQQILTYIDQHREESYQLLLELAQIPSPSNHEEKRAAFCQEWLTRQGAKTMPSTLSTPWVPRTADR